LKKNLTITISLNLVNSREIKSEFTEFTDIKLKENEPIKEQLEKQLKKILNTKRKSGAYFYSETPDIYETMAQQLFSN
jgi:hypothetical protein